MNWSEIKGTAWSLSGSMDYSFLSAPPPGSDYFNPGTTDLNNDPVNGIRHNFETSPGFASLSGSQITAINKVLTGASAYRVSIQDVTDVTFNNTTGTSVGTIAMGGADLAGAGNVAGTFSLPGSESYRGDIWFDNNNKAAVNAALLEGQAGLFTIYHELGHAMGLNHSYIDGTTDLYSIDPRQDNQKYTIMSYNTLGWTGDNTGTTDNALYYDSSTALRAYGLQLYDIKALQEMYGENTTVRTGDTTYKLGQGLGRDGDKDKAFIYTIWDGDTDEAGAGHIDTLDASAFVGYRAKIDLNEGQFSSVGSNGLGKQGFGITDGEANGPNGPISREIQNVAIAYGTVIENAIGGNMDDTIIGNDVGNELTGGRGDDELTGNDGNDTFIWNLGDGSDVITDWASGDVIKFGPGISDSDLTLREYQR